MRRGMAPQSSSSYEQEGVKKFSTEAYEKDTKSGLWHRKFVSRFEVEKDDKQLARQMNSWEMSGELK